MSPSSCDWGFDMEQKKLDDRERLRQYFLTLSSEEQVGGWDVMWQKSITPWDKDQPHPALVEALNEKAALLGSPFQDVAGERIRKKALVPGCGRGYDILLLASFGYDAYGLDASPRAIEEAEKLHLAQGKEQRYPVKNILNGRGKVKFLVADFFSDDFLSQTHSTKSDHTFDLIYDYTFLCALPPPMRARWAARMSQLLSSTGHLICMEYPLGKDPKLGGPPHGLERALYEQLFSKPGQEVVYNLSGHVCEDRSGDKSDNALVKIDEWTPTHVFDGQNGQVMPSVWRHWK